MRKAPEPQQHPGRGRGFDLGVGQIVVALRMAVLKHPQQRPQFGVLGQGAVPALQQGVAVHQVQGGHATVVALFQAMGGLAFDRCPVAFRTSAPAPVAGVQLKFTGCEPPVGVDVQRQLRERELGVSKN